MGLIMPELLASIDQIDAPWLDSVFAEAGVDVPTINNISVAPIGAGNTGITVKVSLDYKVLSPAPDTAAPKSVVCKFHPTDQRIEAIKRAGAFLTEFNAQKLLAENSEAAIPRCYFVAVADDGGQFNMVCEDLSEQCEAGDQIKGCSRNEARAAILELAKLHRQFWKEPGLNDLHWIRPRIPLPENALALLDDRLRKLLTGEQHDIVKQATPRIHDWLGLKPDDETLIHVDCRVDNVLFDHGDAKSPQAYLIDFALVSIGDAVADVAYFLTSSLSPDDRLACEMDMLELHTREIAQKDPAYTFERAMASYRENIVSSLYLTMIAAIGMPDAPQDRMLLTRLFERNCAAVQHWMEL